jgi:hypothetical protein
LRIGHKQQERLRGSLRQKEHPVSASIAHRSTSLSGQSIREQIRIPANPPKTRTEFVTTSEAWITPEVKFSAVVLGGRSTTGQIGDGEWGRNSKELAEAEKTLQAYLLGGIC